MNAFNNGKVRRISKAAARKAYEAGQTIGLCASKMYPSTTGWRLLCEVSAGSTEESFESTVLNYTVYNCTNETGLYPSFYIRIK